MDVFGIVSHHYSIVDEITVNDVSNILMRVIVCVLMGMMMFVLCSRTIKLIQCVPFVMIGGTCNVYPKGRVGC